MRRKVIIILSVLVLAFLCYGCTVLASSSDAKKDEKGSTIENTTEADPDTGELKNGIREENGNIYYYENGVKFTGGYKVIKRGSKKCYYYFRKNGTAVRSKLKKVTINGKGYYFYFQKNGQAKKKQWYKLGKKKYYFGSNGRAYTGVHNISHFYCKFSKNGVLKRKIDKHKKLIAITYDDGPSINTPKILDTLEKYDAVATFFIVGNRASTYSEHISRAHKLGCEIANHTYDHKILTSVGAGEVSSQVKKCNDAVENITSERPIIMRPPGGAVNDTVKNNVGMPMIIWSVDPTDWKTRNQQKTENAVLSQAKDGDVVLMHDLYESTAAAAPKIFSTLKDRGFEFVTVSELAAIRGVKLQKGEKYNSFRK